MDSASVLALTSLNDGICSGSMSQIISPAARFHSSFWSESFIIATERQIGADIGTRSGVGAVMNPIVSAFIALELFPFVDDFRILSW